MGTLMIEEEDMVVLSLKVKVPQNLPFGTAESLEEAIEKAAQIIAASNSFQDVCNSADDLAQLIVTQVRPSGLMLEERLGHKRTIQKVIEEGDWLTAEDINKLQIPPPENKSLPASDWELSRQIFSVTYDGKDYYPRYQFDAMYQPLPVVSDIIKAFGECADTWSLATWFHFPNGWIAKEVGSEAVPVAPKDALNRSSDVIEAARNHKGTYTA